MKKIIICIVTIIFNIFIVNTSYAIIAAEIDSGQGVVYQDGTNYITGWQFTITTPITITALGIFDSDLDGLSQALPVGIYNTDFDLIASTTIPTGTNPDLGLIDEFRFQSITPVDLRVGTYVIASVTTLDNITFEDFAFFAEPEYSEHITNDRPMMDFYTELMFPTVDVTGDGLEDLWGPNFIFDLDPEGIDTPLATTAVKIIPQWEGENDSNDYVFGIPFVVNEPIVITHLGIWDDLEDGLTQDLDVGIYNEAYEVIATTTVPADTTPLLRNGFRYVELDTYLPLAPGNYLVANENHDGVAEDPENYTLEPSNYSSLFGEEGRITIWDDGTEWTEDIMLIGNGYLSETFESFSTLEDWFGGQTLSGPNFIFIDDEFDPELSIFSPEDDSIDIAIDTDLTITFDEDVEVQSGNVSIYKSDNTLIEAIDVTGGLVNGDGTDTITINPTADLEEGTSYYIQIDATAFDDLSGNSYAGIADTTTWTFTTIQPVEEEVEADAPRSRKSVSTPQSRARALARIQQNTQPSSQQVNTPATTPSISIPIGYQSEVIRSLQRFLNMQGYTVATSGPGSPGNETTYFGPLTEAALIRYLRR